VVDSADADRLLVCKAELHQLLKEEKLAGATLLILANKQDLPGSLSAAEIKKVEHDYSACSHQVDTMLELEIKASCNLIECLHS